MSTIITSRLILRPLRGEDAPAIQEHFPHWEIVQHLSDRIPWPYPPDGAEKFVAMRLEQVRTRDDEMWAITLKGDDRLIGVMDYVAEDNVAGNRGFWIGLNWHGQGYMTEAADAFHYYAFEHLRRTKLTFINAVNNPASRRVKEKTGATYVGPATFPHLDGVEESDKWELTADNWRSRRQSTLPSPVIVH